MKPRFQYFQDRKTDIYTAEVKNKTVTGTLDTVLLACLTPIFATIAYYLTYEDIAGINFDDIPSFPSPVSTSEAQSQEVLDHLVDENVDFSMMFSLLDIGITGQGMAKLTARQTFLEKVGTICDALNSTITNSAGYESNVKSYSTDNSKLSNFDSAFVESALLYSVKKLAKIYCLEKNR